MLQIEELTVYAGKKNIINDVSFTSNYGELTAVLALNGIGKTQMLKIIANINPIKYGKILVEGIEPKYDGKTISYLPQNINSMTDFVCEDYIMMGRMPYISYLGSPGEEDRNIVEQAIEKAGIKHLKGRRLYNLSGGELRRVCIAKLLAQDTKIMLLDEPCAYLDCKRQQKIMALIRDIVKAKNKCAVLTLHDPSLAFKFCDKVIFLDSNGVYSEIKLANTDISYINKSLQKIYGEKIMAAQIEDQIAIVWR